MPGLDAEAHQLWPTSAREVAAAGVAALFAFPIRIGAISLGTLELHRRTPGPLSTTQPAHTLAVVDTAAWLILAMTAGDSTAPCPTRPIACSSTRQQEWP
jgi:hypothetical protein